MKKLFTILCYFVLSATALFAQYKKVSVKDIMTLPQDSLNVGSLLSPKLGDTVWLTGVVQVPTIFDVDKGDRRNFLATLNTRWGSFLHDTNSTLNKFASVNIIQSDSNATFTLFDRVHKGDVIEVLVKITNFPANVDLALNRQGGSQVEIITDAAKGKPINFINDKVPLAAAVPATISDFYTGAIGVPGNIATGGKYAGMFVELSNVTIVSVVINGTSKRATIILSDDQGNQIYFRDFSGYFTTGPLKFDPNFNAWPVGQKFTKLRGYISSNSSGGKPVSFMISPMYPADVEIGAAPPVITTVSSPRISAFPTSTDNVTIKFNIRKGDLAIDESKATVSYSTDGVKYNNLTATKVNDTIYSAIIPAQPENTIVRFRTTIADVANAIANNPLGANFYFYKVLNRAPKIADVRQQVTNGLLLSNDGNSGYVGLPVTLEGVITADTSDIPNGNSPRIYIQDGIDPYSGLYLITTKPTDPIRALKRGDKIRIKGTVAEAGAASTDHQNTALTAPTLVDLAGDKGIISHGNNYAPIVMPTSQIGTKRQGDTTAECWEGMLVEFQNVIVKDTNADGASNFGEFNIYSESGSPTGAVRVETEEGNIHLTTFDNIPNKFKMKIGDKYSYFRGVLWLSHSYFKIVPRKDDDYINLTSVAYSPVISNVLSATNYPNPFEAGTTVEFSVEKEGNAIVNLTDEAGNFIQTLMNEQVQTGTYKITLDAQKLASGTYFCTIQTPSGSITKKLVVIH